MKIKCMLFEITAKQIKERLEQGGEKVELLPQPIVEQSEDIEDKHTIFGNDPKDMKVHLPPPEEGYVLLVPGWYQRLYKNLPVEEQRTDCYVLPPIMTDPTLPMTLSDLVHVNLEEPKTD